MVQGAPGQGFRRAGRTGPVDVWCDVRSPASLRRAFAGRAAAIVVAGRYTIQDEPFSRYAQVNVSGARHVVEAAAAEGVQQLVWISSLAVLPPGALQADDPEAIRGPEHGGRAYAQSKALGERLVRRECAARGISLAVLRPCSILGPGDRHVLPFLDRFARGPFGALPAKRWPVVAASDVAELSWRLALRGEGGTFGLVGEAPYLSSLAARSAALQGQRRVVVPVPWPAEPLPTGHAAVRVLQRPLKGWVQALTEALSPEG